MKFEATKRGGNNAISIHDSTGKHAGFIANATPTDITHAKIANDVVDLFRFMTNGKSMIVGNVRMYYEAGKWVVVDESSQAAWPSLIESMNAADAFSILCKRVKANNEAKKAMRGNRYDELVDDIESMITT